MIDDHDIWQAAQLLIKCHGAEAPIFATQRVDELFNEGDLYGAAVWRRIVEEKRPRRLCSASRSARQV